MVRRFVVPLLAAAGASAAAPALAGTSPRPVESRTVAQSSGASSAFTDRASLVIRGQERWERVWSSLTAGEHPRPAPPDVDFGHHMLLVALQGRQPSGGYAIEITGVVRRGRTMRVDVEERSPGPGCVVTAEVTSPYHVVEVRRTCGRVVFRRHTTVYDC
jgi:hypothetical protein